MADTNQVEKLRTEIEELKAQINEEEVKRSVALAEAENAMRVVRLEAQRDELKRQLSELRQQPVPGDAAALAVQPTPEATPNTPEAAPTDPTATPVVDPETANKRR